MFVIKHYSSIWFCIRKINDNFKRTVYIWPSGIFLFLWNLLKGNIGQIVCIVVSKIAFHI